MDNIGKGCIIYLVVCVVILIIFESYKSCSDFFNDYEVGKGKDLTEKYTEALKTEDFEKAHNVLTEIYAYYNKIVNSNRGDSFFGDDDNNIETATTVVCDALKKIYSEEIRYLVYSNEESKWERIVNLLREIVSIGKELPNGAHVNYDDKMLVSSYQQFVQTKNNLCNLSLDLAIDNENEHYAKTILRCYLKNCKINNYEVMYNEDDIDAARKKIKEAFGEKKEEVKEEVQSTPKESKKKRKR